MYPLPGLKDMLTRLIGEGHSEAWLFMCLLGGFVYFDAAADLIQCNALVLTDAPPVSLHLIGPYPASPEALEHLASHHRIQEVTITAMRDSGFREFGWVLAREAPGGEPCLTHARRS